MDFAPTQNFAFKRGIAENFDENFDKGGEDYDFCLRPKVKGYRVLRDLLLYVFHVERGGLRHILRKSWRDGRARAKVFAKHGFHAIRDAFISIFHGFVVLSTPIAAYLIASSSLSIHLMVLMMLLIASLTHRIYRALLLARKGRRIAEAFKLSLATYIAHIAFTATIFVDALRRIVRMVGRKY